MSTGNNIKRFITYIGKNNKPIYPVMLVAAAEMVFRPLFTMMDKKSPEQTKKYTALREAITEMVAVPTYCICGVLAGKAGDLFKDAQKSARAHHNLMTLGVWTAALFVIPGLCSAVVKPFTDKLFSKKGNQEPAKLNIQSQAPKTELPKNQISQTGNLKYPSVKNISLSNFTHQGMRVG